MRLHKLYDVIMQGPEPPDDTKNADAFAELIHYLDDRSLSLVIRDARDDGREALQILREHYLGRGKPRIISLYTELTSLKKGTDECVTENASRLGPSPIGPGQLGPASWTHLHYSSCNFSAYVDADSSTG